MIYQLLWLVPAIPFAGFLALVLFGARLPRRAAGVIGAGSIGLSAVLAIILAVTFMVAPPPGGSFTQTLWTWISVGTFTPGISFRLDALSLVMMVVVTFVGFFIHLYSTGYMAAEEGYHRFFAYMNLFVGAMLTLVLAANLLLLYLGWEGVGLCSFLLIGFWYRDAANGRAAMKAFITTRVGDAAFAVGLLLIFTGLGTLEIQQVLQRAPEVWPVGSTMAILAAALLLGGAVGKSAQLPLQVWLPDAMAGPTPTSALIHAATMVTAGVYLIARMHPIFQLAPPVMLAVAIIGLATLLIAGVSALVQWDLKRVLAYSTISQIGYMFLALGVGAWSAAIFHLTTHAFFKALLFLGAGVVIASLHHTQDMREMGGLRARMPIVFWTFLIGALSLAALPFITAGFYSKDLILLQVWATGGGANWLWGGAWLGALLTSLYTFRMVFYTFFGTAKREPAWKPSLVMAVPLVVLAFFSAVAGFIELPRAIAHFSLFSDLLNAVFPPSPALPVDLLTEVGLLLASVIASSAGLLLAYVLYLRRRSSTEAFFARQPAAALAQFWRQGWGFDWLYERLFVRPYAWLAHANRHDVVDRLYNGLGQMSMGMHRAMRTTENGNVRWYAAGITAGAVLLIVIMVYR